MNCNDVKKELYFYFNSEVEQELKHQIEMHLKTCFACQKNLEDISSTLKLVKGFKIDIPKKNWDVFSNEILKKIYKPKIIVKFLKPAIAVAFVILLFVFCYKYYRLKSLEKVELSGESFELVSYLTDFDIPELSK